MYSQILPFFSKRPGRTLVSVVLLNLNVKIGCDSNNNNCNSIKECIIGEWEEIPTNNSSDGQTQQFFGDGTLVLKPGISYIVGQLVGKYSWPDDKHIKTEFPGVSGSFGGVGIGVTSLNSVFEVVISGNNLSLTNITNGHKSSYQRFKEMIPSADIIAGDWHAGWPRESNCFGLIPEDPQIFQSLQTEIGLSFSKNGTFILASYRGNYTIQSNELIISNYSLPLTPPPYQVPTATPNPNAILPTFILPPGTTYVPTNTPVIASYNKCELTLSAYRLKLTDDKGKITIFVRKPLNVDTVGELKRAIFAKMVGVNSKP